jgi:hypothetical protein
MTVVSNCDGVMGAEERLNTKSGYGYLKIVCSEMNLAYREGHLRVHSRKQRRVHGGI